MLTTLFDAITKASKTLDASNPVVLGQQMFCLSTLSKSADSMSDETQIRLLDFVDNLVTASMAVENVEGNYLDPNTTGTTMTTRAPSMSASTGNAIGNVLSNNIKL